MLRNHSTSVTIEQLNSIKTQMVPSDLAAELDDALDSEAEPSGND
jgi:hypothetical protein